MGAQETRQALAPLWGGPAGQGPGGPGPDRGRGEGGGRGGAAPPGDRGNHLERFRECQGRGPGGPDGTGYCHPPGRGRTRAQVCPGPDSPAGGQGPIPADHGRLEPGLGGRAGRGGLRHPPGGLVGASPPRGGLAGHGTPGRGQGRGGPDHGHPQGQGGGAGGPGPPPLRGAAGGRGGGAGSPDGGPGQVGSSPAGGAIPARRCGTGGAAGPGGPGALARTRGGGAPGGCGPGSPNPPLHPPGGGGGGPGPVRLPYLVFRGGGCLAPFGPGVSRQAERQDHHPRGAGGVGVQAPAGGGLHHGGLVPGGGGGGALPPDRRGGRLRPGGRTTPGTPELLISAGRGCPAGSRGRPGGAAVQDLFPYRPGQYRGLARNHHGPGAGNSDEAQGPRGAGGEVPAGGAGGLPPLAAQAETMGGGSCGGPARGAAPVPALLE